MFFLKKLFGRFHPVSQETIRYCLEHAEKEKTLLDVTDINKKVFHGIFLQETASEITLKCENEFIGISKNEIAKIAISQKKTILKGAQENRKEQNDQKELIDMLKGIPTIDPPVNSNMLKSTTTDPKTIQDLQTFFKKNKWICYYDGKNLKSGSLLRVISVPKAVKYSLPQTGFYLCSIYAMKGKVPPILVMSSAVYITPGLVDFIRSQPIIQEDSKFSSPSLLDLLHHEFKNDQPYKLSAVGDAIKIAGIDISSYGHTKLSDLFVSLQSEEIELGKDETNQPVVTFHWKKTVTPNDLPDGSEVWRSFIAAFLKTCQYGQDYQLAPLTLELAANGFRYEDFGYSKMLPCLLSFPKDLITISYDSNGHPLVKVLKQDIEHIQKAKVGEINPLGAGITDGSDTWHAFLNAFSKICQYEQDYPLAALTEKLSANGFRYEDFGYSKMLSCLQSFPQNQITISYDINGHPLVRVQKQDIVFTQSGETWENNPQDNTLLSRRGIISAYYPIRGMGFIIESSSNQTWWFDDNLIRNPDLLQSLHDGVTGQDIVFDGKDTVLEGKTYPIPTGIRFLSNDLQINRSISRDLEEKNTVSTDSSNGMEQYSKFSIQQMAECSYEGIDAKSLQEGSFSSKDIEGIRYRLRMLEKTRGYVPKVLSEYYLTLAALSLKIDKSSKTTSRYLRQYFSLQAEACMLDLNMPHEVIRFYCVEALRVSDPNFKSAFRLVFLLFLSYEPSLGLSRGYKTLDDIRNLLAKMKEMDKIQDVVSDLPYYRAAIPHFFPLIMDVLKEHVSVDENALSIVDHQWKQIYPLCESIKNISGFALTQVRDRLLPISHSFSSFDQQRYNHFLEIFSALIEYSQKRFFSDREITKLQIDQASNDFLQDYKSRPTELLVEALVPALRHLQKILNEDFQQMQNLMPELSVENVLETDGYTLTPNGTIELKLSICNLNEATPPVESIELSLQGRPCQESYYPGVLWGRKEMSLIFSPSEKEIEDKAFSVNVMMSFRTRTGEKQAGPFPISIQLEKNSFETIPNPYLPYAGGNPIEATDDTMFYGRNALVQEICEQLSRPYSGQCYVLYGQKRSGKTSVMKHIQNFLPRDAFYTQVSAQAFNYDKDALLSTFAKHVLEQVDEVAFDKSIEIQNLPSLDFANSDPVLALKHISRSLKKKGLNWIISIDEFTYIYSNARESAEAFMHAWKALLQDHVFNALIIGQDTMPQFKQAFPNDFCVSHDRRLTFLSEEDSILLAWEPIAKEDGESRYRGNSLAKIYQKTAGSPFFLQKFCSETVKYLNKKGSPYITEADIDNISDNLVHGRVDSSLHKEDFDALVVAGDSKLSPVPVETLWKVLTVIALHSIKKGWCSFSDLESVPDFMEAINDLKNRDTIQVDNDEVCIRVELFADWLRINNKGIIE